MKKLAKIALGAITVTACAVSAGAIAGCSKGGNGTGEAYAATHQGGYVGYAKVVLDGDKITEVKLVEVCLPTQVKAAADVPAADKVGTNYKTVSYDKVTLTYDAASNGYKTADGTLFTTYLQSSKNAKAYYEAVLGNKITVTVGGEAKTGVMTNDALNKEKNGYWTTGGGSKVEGETKWLGNRDATVKYVMDNGVSKLKELTKITEEGDNKGFWTDGTVVTGATWNDLNPSDKEGKIYSTYAELILDAYNKAK